MNSPRIDNMILPPESGAGKPSSALQFRYSSDHVIQWVRIKSLDIDNGLMMVGLVSAYARPGHVRAELSVVVDHSINPERSICILSWHWHTRRPLPAHYKPTFLTKSQERDLRCHKAWIPMCGTQPLIVSRPFPVLYRFTDKRPHEPPFAESPRITDSNLIFDINRVPR